VIETLEFESSFSTELRGTKHYSKLEKAGAKAAAAAAAAEGGEGGGGARICRGYGNATSVLNTLKLIELAKY
jgi:hypothetical protein